MLWLLVSKLFPLFIYVTGSQEEFRLIQDLKENYDVIERPVLNHSMALPVKMKVFLQQIVDLDEKSQSMTLVIWSQLSWTDYKLRWNLNEYGNISKLQVPKNMVWKPDVLLFNSVNTNFDANFPVNCIVHNTGDVYITPPGIALISCQLTMTWFPFDQQICFLKYGSWTYGGHEVDLDHENGSTTLDMTYYVPSEEFEILETIANRTVRIYGGKRYIELFFYIHLKRRSQYYVINWVLPSVLISMSNILQFMMPTAGGEKVTLQTTNILAVLVFLAATSKNTPPTSESIPVLAMFLSASLCIMGASTCGTLLIMNVHFRSAALREMGPWTKRTFLKILPKLLLMPKGIEKGKQEECEDCEKQIELTRAKAEELKSQASSMHSEENPEQSIMFTKLEENLNDVLEVLHIFDEKFEEGRADKKLEDDWKFMANVLDRICLLLYFSLVAVVVLSLGISSQLI